MTQAMGTLRSLEETLAYKNDTLIYKFLENFDITFEEAEDLFTETKRFMWLAARIRKEKPEDQPELIINEPMLMVDEMWHNFVLFTREYADFCHTYLGRFIHHAPTPEHERQASRKEAQENPEGYEERIKAKLYKLYEYVYDVLGEEIAIKWYEEYGTKYPSEVIQAKFKGWVPKTEQAGKT